MSFFHGVKTREVPTSIITPVQTEYTLPVVFGTAAVHKAKNPAKANEPVLCYQYSEFVNKFGESTDYDKYTLQEVADSQFKLFNASPTVFVNVLDVNKHYANKELDLTVETGSQTEIESEMILDSLEVISTDTTTVTLTGDVEYRTSEDTDTQVTTIDLVIGASLPSDSLNVEYNVDTDTVAVKVSVDDFPYTLPSNATNLVITADKIVTNNLVAYEDFTAAYNSAGNINFTILDDSKIFNNSVNLKWHEIFTGMINYAEIVGGYDSDTGKNTGLEVIEDIFPKFGLVPTIIIAPKYSCSPTVAAVMKAKCTAINSVFKAVAIADIPTDTVKTYTDVVEYKTQHNLVDENLVVCWPKVKLEDAQYHMSTQLAGLMCRLDGDDDVMGVFESPSNRNLQCDSLCLTDDTEVLLNLTQANYLNSQGIYTALNFNTGFRGWGNYSSIYPTSTDVKDMFLAVRRAFNFLNNQLVLMFWQKIDNPMNHNLVEAVVDEANIYMNGLMSRGAILGGRVEISSDENPATDLMAGIIKFHVFWSPAIPAQEIDFILEYDPTYLNSLFA